MTDAPDDLPPPWTPKPGPSSREYQFHAMRAQVRAVIQLLDGMMAQLAAMESGGGSTASTVADSRASQPTDLIAARKVLNRVREKQQTANGEVAP